MYVVPAALPLGVAAHRVNSARSREYGSVVVAQGHALHRHHAELWN